MGFGVNLNIDIVGLVKYVHSNWLYKRSKKRAYELALKRVVDAINQMVDQEKKILFDLLKSNNAPIQSVNNDYFTRLQQVGLIYIIPNSDKSIFDDEFDKAKNQARNGGIKCVGYHVPDDCKQYLYALTYDALQLLNYLEEQKLLVLACKEK